MPLSGRLDPEPPDDGSDERDYVTLLNSALLDLIDLAQPNAALDAILARGRARCPARHRRDARCADRDRPQDGRARRGREL